jgi:uncharacterized phage protein (TIGR02218 family)
VRTISAGLEAHFAQECTTIATLWLVTRTDGQVFGFTDHDRNLEVDGVTYEAASGYTRSAVRAQLGLAVDNLELDGALDSDNITAADIRAGLWDYAAVRISLVNWADLSQGQARLKTGKLGDLRTMRNGFQAELRGLTQHLQQSAGRLYMPGCDANLGDARCGINLALFTITGTITGVTSPRVFADSGRAEADGYFDGGKITWTSGNNVGTSMEVKSYLLSGGAIALQLPMAYDVQVGDTYSMHAGCDKTFATCRDKFSNVINFQGFPHLPGMDRMINGGL